MNTHTGRSKQAKARKLSTSTYYQVSLLGIAWQGFTGTYVYTFNHDPTLKEVNARAGDFQHVIDYETIEVKTIQYTDGDRRIIKTVRPWEFYDSEEKFLDANAA